MAFVERLIQCRDWLQFSPEVGPDMAAIGGCIIDLIAIGQSANARVLHDASLQVLGANGYDWQQFWRNRKGTKPEIPDEQFPA